MTIKELLEMANQSLVKLGEEDADDLAACQTWAIAAHAYAATAQAMMLQMYLRDMDDAQTTANWIQDHA